MLPCVLNHLGLRASSLRTKKAYPDATHAGTRGPGISFAGSGHSVKFGTGIFPGRALPPQVFTIFNKKLIAESARTESRLFVSVGHSSTKLDPSGKDEPQDGLILRWDLGCLRARGIFR